MSAGRPGRTADAEEPAGIPTVPRAAAAPGPEPEVEPAGRRHALDALPSAGLRRLTAFDTVRARIGLAVDLGLLRPGERLPSSLAIAEALEVGEMTVRRALVSLVQDGVLERRRGRDGGTMVAPEPAHGVVREIGTFESAAVDVTQLIDQRLILECGIAHLAALHADAVDHSALRGLIAGMEAAASWADFHRLDERFHMRLAASAGIGAADTGLRLVLHALYRYFLPYPIEYLRASNEEHRALVSALERRDALAAVDVVRGHVEELHRSMFTGLLAAGKPAVPAR